jgi:hypothetical protein
MKIVNMLATLSLVSVAISILATLAHCQSPYPVTGSVFDAMSFTGQAWTSNGVYSPLEPGNVLFQTYAEQTASVFSTWHNSVTVVPYVATSMTFDTKGYSWNNKIQPSMGIRVSKIFPHGVISAGTAYMYEDRFQASKAFKASGRTDYVSCWFGWQTVSNDKNRFPGSTWAVIGHISPVERGNLIEQQYITQGYVLHRFSRASIVPYSELTLGHDSQGLDWENKVVSGGGVKVAVPMGNIYADLGTGVMQEHRFNSGVSATGLRVFLNVSYTWHLFGKGSN